MPEHYDRVYHNGCYQRVMLIVGDTGSEMVIELTDRTRLAVADLLYYEELEAWMVATD